MSDYQTKKFENSIVRTEAGFSLNPAEPTFFTMINNDVENKWGAKGGYKIVPSTFH